MTTPTTEPQNTPLAETKHTATPWTIAQYGDITGADGDVLLLRGVALPCGSHSRRPEADANREFVVRACNAHDDLVAALKDAQTVLGMLVRPETDGANVPLHIAFAQCLAAESKCRAALAKANGGAL